MSKEQLLPYDSEEIKNNIKESLAKSAADFLNQESDITVSQAQREAFGRVVDAIPDGKFKDIVAKLEGMQKVSSKVNEFIYGVQDKSWNIAKPLVSLRSPLLAFIPKDPFSKLAIKSSKAGGAFGEKVIKSTISGADKLKIKVRKFKDRKKSKEV
jgi:hypothetical protein